mmetsp:Transcript_19382/g.40876  ORF Transcript_19382/g.40876 Transcript_19382/m.40876 type:complete len:116 (+) Transcript_19382:871-1218(+)
MLFPLQQDVVLLLCNFRHDVWECSSSASTVHGEGASEWVEKQKNGGGMGLLYVKKMWIIFQLHLLKCKAGEQYFLAGMEFWPVVPCWESNFPSFKGGFLQYMFSCQSWSDCIFSN